MDSFARAPTEEEEGDRDEERTDEGDFEADLRREGRGAHHGLNSSLLIEDVQRELWIRAVSLGLGKQREASSR